jgi:integrase
LKKAGIDYRPIIQARHTFSTMTVSAGENLGWFQRTMGAGFLEANERKTDPIYPK